MRHKKTLFSTLLAFLIIGLTYSFASASLTDFRTDVDDEGLWEAPDELKHFSKPFNEVVLNPGMTTSCEKGFIAQNMGNTVTEIELIAGDKQTKEEIQPQAVMSYNLMSKSGAEQEAIILNSGDSTVMVECR